MDPRAGGSGRASGRPDDETANIYLAEGLRPAARPADPTEFIEVRAFPFTEVLRMVERDEIKDSIVAVLHAARRRV